MAQAGALGRSWGSRACRNLETASTWQQMFKPGFTMSLESQKALLWWYSGVVKLCECMRIMNRYVTRQCTSGWGMRMRKRIGVTHINLLCVRVLQDEASSKPMCRDNRDCCRHLSKLSRSHGRGHGCKQSLGIKTVARTSQPLQLLRCFDGAQCEWILRKCGDASTALAQWSGCYMKHAYCDTKEIIVRRCW